MDKAAIEQSVYSIKDQDLNLIGTAEQSLLAMHSGDVIPEEKLPRKIMIGGTDKHVVEARLAA